jgi:hypothetical protein
LLGKNAPDGRPIERFGDIVAHAILGGLHHRYTRIWFLEATAGLLRRLPILLQAGNQRRRGDRIRLGRLRQSYIAPTRSADVRTPGLPRVRPVTPRRFW